MRQIIGILTVILFGSSSLSAQIVLERSQLLSSSTQSLQSGKEPGRGFTELQDSSRGHLDFKKPDQAFLMSLIVPGAGERYVGSHLKSKLFFFSEIGLWSTLLSFRHLGKWRENDFKLLAATAAGADVSGKDDHYFDMLGFYDSREQYNKIGGVYEHTRPYYPDTKSYFWRWESAEARQKYRSLKNDSKSYFRNANFALALIITNHLLSAVDAYWSATRSNRHIESGFSGVNLELLPEGGWQVQLSARF